MDRQMHIHREFWTFRCTYSLLYNALLAVATTRRSCSVTASILRGTAANSAVYAASRSLARPGLVPVVGKSPVPERSGKVKFTAPVNRFATRKVASWCRPRLSRRRLAGTSAQVRSRTNRNPSAEVAMASTSSTYAALPRRLEAGWTAEAKAKPIQSTSPSATSARARRTQCFVTRRRELFDSAGRSVSRSVDRSGVRQGIHPFFSQGRGRLNDDFFLLEHRT